jgi:hypothetical protein
MPRDCRYWNAFKNIVETRDLQIDKRRLAMYENPKLNLVGNAENVILGTIGLGSDLDTTWMIGQDEFADDGDETE